MKTQLKFAVDPYIHIGGRARKDHIKWRYKYCITTWFN